MRPRKRRASGGRALDNSNGRGSKSRENHGGRSRKRAASSSLSVLRKPSTRIGFDVEENEEEDEDDDDEHDDDANDSEIESEDEEEEYGGRTRSGDNDEEDDDGNDNDEEETADERRIRLAREYLTRIERAAEDDDGDDDGSNSDSSDDTSGSDGSDDKNNAKGKARTSTTRTRDERTTRELERARHSRTGGGSTARVADGIAVFASRLWEDMRRLGRRNDDYDNDAEAWARLAVSVGAVSLRRGHDLTVTAVALGPTRTKKATNLESGAGASEEVPMSASASALAYSASKDGSVLMWDLAFQDADTDGGGGGDDDDDDDGMDNINDAAAKSSGVDATITANKTTVRPRWDKHTSKQDDEATGIHATSKKHDRNHCGDRAGAEVLSLAASDDGTYLAAACRNGSIQIYDVRRRNLPQQRRRRLTSPLPLPTPSPSPVWIATLTGHKSAVSSLAFRPRTREFFSGSYDRTIRRWDLDLGGTQEGNDAGTATATHVETLYGHQAYVTCVSHPPFTSAAYSTCTTNSNNNNNNNNNTSFQRPNKDRPISVGRDRTVRCWKVNEETHLIYRPEGKSSSNADCVVWIDGYRFITGHDDGTIRLWTSEKKRPIDVIVAAHGYVDNGEGGRGVRCKSLPRGITCVDAVPNSDLVVTGSHDGYLRLWKLRLSTSSLEEEEEAEAEIIEEDNADENDNDMEQMKKSRVSDKKMIRLVGKIPIWGYINSIVLGPNGAYAILAVGQEPRLGRWDRVCRARNRLVIVNMTMRSAKTKMRHCDSGSNGQGGGGNGVATRQEEEEEGQEKKKKDEDSKEEGSESESEDESERKDGSDRGSESDSEEGESESDKDDDSDDR